MTRTLGSRWEHQADRFQARTPLARGILPGGDRARAGETAPAAAGAAPGAASGLGTYLFFFAVAAGFVALPFFLALALNRRFQRRNPGKRPYRWGYFVSIVSFVAGVALGVVLEAGPAVFVACVLVHGVLAWGFARRRRWAWIALTILTFNPIALIVNLVYLRRRWREDALLLARVAMAPCKP